MSRQNSTRDRERDMKKSSMVVSCSDRQGVHETERPITGIINTFLKIEKCKQDSV